MADSEDVNTLKRRGRRRLVGAIALVLLAVIVLPMVFDSEPRSSAPPVSVRIPAEDDAGFAPKSAPKAAEKAAEKAPEKAAESAPEKTPEKAAEKPAEPKAPPVAEKAPEKPAEKVAEKALEKAPEKAPKIEIKVNKPVGQAAAAAAPAPVPESAKAAPAPAGAEQFMVPAGAYADPSGVLQRLKEAKIPYFTEPVATKQGTVIRVRAGPFASRAAAERALKQLKDLGLKPGNIAAKS